MFWIDKRLWILLILLIAFPSNSSAIKIPISGARFCQILAALSSAATATALPHSEVSTQTTTAALSTHSATAQYHPKNVTNLPNLNKAPIKKNSPSCDVTETIEIEECDPNIHQKIPKKRGLVPSLNAIDGSASTRSTSDTTTSNNINSSKKDSQKREPVPDPEARGGGGGGGGSKGGASGDTRGGSSGENGGNGDTTSNGRQGPKNNGSSKSNSTITTTPETSAGNRNFSKYSLVKTGAAIVTICYWGQMLV